MYCVIFCFATLFCDTNLIFIFVQCCPLPLQSSLLPLIPPPIPPQTLPDMSLKRAKGSKARVRSPSPPPAASEDDPVEHGRHFIEDYIDSTLAY